MRARRRWWWRGLAMAVAVCAAGVESGVARGNPPKVDLLAPGGSRVAEDLRRELGASGMVVVVVAWTTEDWRAGVARLATQEPRRGVVVSADERLMTVFTRTSPAGVVETRFQQPVDPADRMARRRACLRVVEYVRVLVESDAARVEDDGPSGRRTVRSASPSPRPSVASDADGSMGASHAQSDSERNGSGEANNRSGADGATGPSGGNRMTSPDGVQTAAAAGALVGTDSAVEDQGPPQRWPWELGVGSTLNLPSAPGGPTGHVQFVWCLPFRPALTACVRGLWPVLGAQFRTAGNDVRAWTFGGAFSLQYLFGTAGGRLRPFLGAGLGMRVGLTETTASDAVQSRGVFTPAATLGAEAGVRYAVRDYVQLFFEAGLVRGWLLPGIERLDFESKVAVASALHVSFGMLFKL